MVRQNRAIFIGAVDLLLSQDFGDLLPDGDNSMGTRRQIMFDRLVQAAEMVAGHRGVHMVLGMKIHMPIEEADQRIKRERPAAKTEIGDLILEADMLRLVAEKE